MHNEPSPLILPNAWDVVGALIFAQAGCRALGTTSAGIAATLGYPDGERVPRAEMLDVVARIARAVALPVTADIEAGYGATPEEAARTAKMAIAAGAVGINLEDGTGDVSRPLADIAARTAKIRAIRAVAAAAAMPLVLNARTDIYWLGVKRVSIGSAPIRATLGLVRRIADELLQQGTYAGMTTGAIPYAEVNDLLACNASP